MVAGKMFRAPRPRSALSEKQKKQTRSIVKATMSRALTTNHYNEVGPVNCGSTAVVTDLSTLARGTAEGSFTGDEIIIKGWELRYNVRAVGNTTDPSFSRIILFQWRMDDTDEVPVVGDILYDTTTDAHVSNYEDNGKFKVLLDRMVTLNENHVGGRTNQAGYARKFKGFNKKMFFQPGASTGRGKIYLLTLGDLASNPPSLEYHFRLHYKD